MRTIYIDTETHQITLKQPVPRMVCLQYAIDDADPVIVLAQEGRALVHKWLADPNTRLVAHNGFFDAAVLYEGAHHAAWPFVKAIADGRYRDTMILAKLHAIEHAWIQDPKARFSLAHLYKLATNGLELAGKSGPDIWRMRYAELDGVPVAEWPEAAREYALMDITALRTVYKALTMSGQTYPDEIAQTRKAWDLRIASDTGLHTDPKQRAALTDALRPRVAAVKDTLAERGLFKRSPAEFDEAAFTADVLSLCAARGVAPKYTPGGKLSRAAGFLAQLGLSADLSRYRKWDGTYTKDTKAIAELVQAAFDEPLLTDSGRIATSRKVLRESGHEDLLLLAEVGEAETILNTFIPALTPDVLHPHWNPLVASGRVSVSQPNINNMPRYPGLREIIVAPPGYAFVDADYTQAELCALSQACIDMFGFSRMGEIINENKDLHAWFGAIVIGVEYDDFVARLAAGDKVCKDARQLAKAFNFGAPGGLGPVKFVQWAWDTYQVRLTVDRVRALKEMWLNTFPEIRLYFEWVKRQLNGRETFTMTQLRSNRRRGGLGFCDGCNTTFQGLTADGAMTALRLFTDAAVYDSTSPAYGARPLALIYDELLVLAPIDRVHEVGLVLQDSMLRGMNQFTPDVPARVTMEAMYRWTKNAKRKTDEQGRLVPFDTNPWAL